MALLDVSGLEVSYGLIKAIKGVDFYVNEGEIVALIGANGAGKTTLVSCISRLIPVSAGSIRFCGEDITSYPSEKAAGLGIVQIP